jgi:hypothetical protein
MSRNDFALYIGETWTIDGAVRDADGEAVDMSGGTVEFRISTPTALVVKLTSPGEITIAPGAAGLYTIQLDAADGRQSSIVGGVYDYEVDAIAANGAVSVQNRGKITLRPSLRKLFPGV